MPLNITNQAKSVVKKVTWQPEKKKKAQINFN